MRVCVVTGSRAEFGLLRWVMHEINASNKLVLQLIVTGSHLAKGFGASKSEIDADGFTIDYFVETQLASDTSIGVAKSTGLGLIGIADALGQLKPDIMLVLGDRYETFAAVCAAFMARIPIAHIHGGELTEGAIDDALRHAITKMSHLHFVAEEEYRKRVIQMGEQPNTVHTVGALGPESVSRTNAMSRAEVEDRLGIDIENPTFLVTYHPVTLEKQTSLVDLQSMLSGFAAVDAQYIFTMPNADSENEEIRHEIMKFCSRNPNAYFFDSLGQDLYISTMRLSTGVIGNSSSGLLEAPALGVPSVNIGNRQTGRVRAPSVIDCDPRSEDVILCLRQIMAERNSHLLGQESEPAKILEPSKQIVALLEEESLPRLLKKKFYDAPDLNSL